LAARAFGLSSVDITTAATVLIDHDVIGFRPDTSRPLPLAPLAILSDPTGIDPQSWEYNVVRQQGPDQFAYDRTTKSIVAAPTGDGLHEITVQLAPSAGPFTGANGCVLTIGTGSAAEIAAQIQGGVTPAQLQSSGVPFVLD